MVIPAVLPSGNVYNFRIGFRGLRQASTTPVFTISMEGRAPPANGLPILTAQDFTYHVFPKGMTSLQTFSAGTGQYSEEK